MKKTIKRTTKTVLGIAGVLLLTVSYAAMAGEVTTDSARELKPPFSGPANVKFAERLWTALSNSRLVGPNTIVSYPYEGAPPHGDALELLQSKVTVDGRSGIAIVKKNYRAQGDEEETEDSIFADRTGMLLSVTVMFKRESGYDPDDGNWFWAKYKPDGSLEANPKGMKLAGRVAKGADQGCIACHRNAEGGDFVYSHDQFR